VKAWGVDVRRGIARRLAMALTIGRPTTFTVVAARHARKKATKGHTDTRPKKHRVSDKVRAPVSYPEMKTEDKPAVFTVVSR
jgi:50S ribosomal protein 6